MSKRVKKALPWVAIFLLAIPVIIDLGDIIGLKRAWQYVYNTAYFFVVLPLLIAIATNENPS